MNTETGFDIVEIARANEDFRRVLVTGDNTQVVAMTIPPGGEIGDEVHEHVDQVLILVEGRGEAVLEGQRRAIDENDLVFVKAGTRHNFVNASQEPLRLVSIYSPPEHAPGTVHATKEEAEAEEPGSGRGS